VTAPQPPNADQLAAYRAGRDAFLAGETGTDCPYVAEDPDGLRRLWVRGYVQTRAKIGAPLPQLPPDDGTGG
jgi:hypothetical protein